MGAKIKPEYAKELGAQLRLAREKFPLTLEEIGELSGVHYTQISKIERGDFKRLSDNVQKICRKMEVSFVVSEGPNTSPDDASRIAALTPGRQRLLRAILDLIEREPT